MPSLPYWILVLPSALWLGTGAIVMSIYWARRWASPAVARWQLRRSAWPRGARARRHGGVTMHTLTHTDSPAPSRRPVMLSKAMVLKALRAQRQILTESPSSTLAQGGVLELDRAISAISRME